MKSDTLNEATRQRLLAIRKHFRALLAGPGGQPLPDKAVFYSGVSNTSIAAFCSWLGFKNPSFLGATNLESLPAGIYLSGLKGELQQLFGTEDYDKVQSFALPDGQSFSGSINGMWRELSARYARACSGTVHVLVARERVWLHRASLAYWAGGRPSTQPWRDLRVLGFVELPILVGLLSENSGVTAVNVYTEDPRWQFALVQQA